jgi:hypothetical protein
MKKSLVIILSIVCTILLGTSIYLGFKVYQDSKNNTSKTIDTRTPTDTSTDETPVVDDTPEVITDVPTLPDGWVYRESTLYKYKIGEPSSWYYRFFDSTKYVGLDTATIPEATEYAGIITFGIYDSSFLTGLPELKAGLVTPTTKAVIINGNAWTEISGTIASDSAFFAGYKQIVTYITYEGKIFVAYFTVPSASYSTYLDVYNKALDSAVLDTTK